MAAPESTSPSVRVCTLKEKLGAIQVGRHDGPRLGLFTELPAGAEIEIYDAGFNDATVKVRCRGELYFVFRQDIGLSVGTE